MKKQLRMSGIKIMAALIVLLGSLSFIMLLAVINGSLGFITAMSVTVFGSVAVAKALGATITLSWGWIIGLTIGCGLLRGILKYFEQYSNHYIAFKLLAVLRDKIFKSLRILAPAKLESKQKGSLISMLTSDIETLEVFYAHTISPICIAVLVSLSTFLFVGFISSFYLALVALLGYLIIGILLPYISFKRLKKPGVTYRQEFSSFNAYFLDSIMGIKDIIIHNGEKSREQEVNRRSDILLNETKKIKKVSSKNSALTELLVSLFITLTLMTGILLVNYHQLSLGYMIIGVVTIFSSFGPMIAISNLPSNLNQTFASGDRVINLLKEEPIVKEITNKKEFKYETLDVNNLNFSYEKDKKILSDICFHAKQGEIIGIIGESGSGKSTFLKLLLRFFEKDSGSIQYGDIEIDEINTSSLLNNVTMVFQNTYLFDETIEDNLLIANPNASHTEVINACKAASIHEFISSLPNGYHTKVQTMGDNLSAGEKQRIGLARAFLRDSPLILLDEPTSNVDSINEGIILKSLIEQKHKRSIILVSHRQSTMAIADRKYQITNGHMEEITNDR